MTRLAGFRWTWLSLGVVLLDQVTKYLLERFTAPGQVHQIIPGLLNLVNARNPGVAFSILADFDSDWLRPALIAFSLAAIGLLGWLLWSGRAGGTLTRWGLALALGGAAGNVVDRLLFGAVFDFIDVHVRHWHWPAFNVADSAITIGLIFVVWEMLFGRRR